jgi:hypothetical protein
MWLFKKDKSRQQQNREPRVRLLPGEAIYFEDSTQKYKVENISESGLAFAKTTLQVGQRISGSLHIAKEAISLELEVMRAGETTTGLRIRNGEKLLRGALRRVFTDEYQAMGMSAVSSELLQAEAAGIPHWFYAPGNYELYLVEKDNKVVKAHVSWKDRIVAASSGEGIKTGFLQQEDREVPAHAKSALVNWLPAVDEQDKQKALRIVENIGGLSAQLKAELKKLFG